MSTITVPSTCGEGVQQELEREGQLEFTRSPGAYLYRAAVNLSLNVVQN